MDLDLSSLWSWTVPLWGLFLIILFLGGVLTQPVSLMALAPVRGGARGGKKVRFSL